MRGCLRCFWLSYFEYHQIWPNTHMDDATWATPQNWGGGQVKQKQTNNGVKCTKGFEKMCKSCHILREKGIIH
jgi:hypothetical protein